MVIYWKMQFSSTKSSSNLSPRGPQHSRKIFRSPSPNNTATSILCSSRNSYYVRDRAPHRNPRPSPRSQATKPRNRYS
ncbi:hypothetical protein BJX76DRAFT_260323 [Aspergillus varians]